MSDLRFKLLFFNREWHPWELYEWCKPTGWFKRGHWVLIQSTNTREESVKYMTDKVEGEARIQPSYYDQFGNLDVSY